MLELSEIGFAERELSLPAQRSRLLEARRFAERAAADFGFDDSERAQIKLAANEAVTNAIEHGSPHPDGEIQLRAVAEDGGLAIYVRDAGVFIPRTPHDELPERGRGFAFMDKLMDEVDVRPSADGTVIRLIRRLR